MFLHKRNCVCLYHCKFVTSYQLTYSHIHKRCIIYDELFYMLVYDLYFTVRFVVPRLVLLKILVFVECDVVSLSELSWHCEGSKSPHLQGQAIWQLIPENDNTTFFQNVSNYSPKDLNIYHVLSMFIFQNPWRNLVTQVEETVRR